MEGGFILGQKLKYGRIGGFLNKMEAKCGAQNTQTWNSIQSGTLLTRIPEFGTGS